MSVLAWRSAPQCHAEYASGGPADGLPSHPLSATEEGEWSTPVPEMIVTFNSDENQKLFLSTCLHAGGILCVGTIVSSRVSA